MATSFRTMLAVTAVLALSACGFVKGKQVAAKSVDAFHEDFNAGRFSEIYRKATPTFKSTSPEAKFLEFIRAVRGKLGAFTSGTQVGWRTNVTPAGTTVVLSYNSKFERGSAQEVFTVIVSGETASLQGYNVNSPELITNSLGPIPNGEFENEKAAQQEAVRRYPELGKVDSALNKEFVARHKRLQQEHPEALRDPSWPLRLAEEAAQAVK